MIYRTLGRTELKVSLVSYGSGGPSKLGQNTGISSNDQDLLIHKCIDSGVNLFDTSEAYGDSESILARGLKGVPRDSYILATKCRYLDRGGVMRTPEDIARSIENSLVRLQVDYVDVLQFHVFNSKHYFDVVEQHHPVLKRFQEQGKIRFIGFSEQFMVEHDHKGVVLALETHPELWDVIAQAIEFYTPEECLNYFATAGYDLDKIKSALDAGSVTAIFDACFTGTGKQGKALKVARILSSPRGHPKPPSQTWRKFLDNHMGCFASIDFFVVPTATFAVLFVFIVLRHERRRIEHFGVTAHPTADWVAQQVREAFPWATAPQYLIRDRP